MDKRIAISFGDYNGIGTEIILKHLQGIDYKQITPIISGSSKVLDFYSNLLDLPLEYRVIQKPAEIQNGIANLFNVGKQERIDINPGELKRYAGKCAMLAVEKCIDLCIGDYVDAMVTAPISKEAVNLAGYQITGHTEFLAERTGTGDYMMMLVNDELRVGLVSVHVPVKSVTDSITETNITRHIRLMHKSLVNDFGIKYPRIAVLGLNPHAGDGGVIGDEEIRIINPALQKARFNDILVDGPLPADGLFGSKQYKEYDGILAMYHDQGLIPFKTLSFGAGVNFTAGLPIIRTSPDHGTAFDIAGQNAANPESFGQAFDLAVLLSESRHEQVKE